MTNDPPDALPPPPRRVRYLPFVRTQRIGWAIILSTLVLFPVICSLMGLTHSSIGGTPAPPSALVLNAKVIGHTLDSTGEAYLDLEYQVGNVVHRNQTWVPKSYYSQMAGSVYAPITVPDPKLPTDFYIGPPRGEPGLAFWQIYWTDGVIAVCLLVLCIYIEGNRAIEFRLLRHGYATMGTIELESRPEGEVQEMLKITTREGPIKELLGYGKSPGECPPPGTILPVLYMPDNPSTMKPLTDFKCCELEP